MPSTKKTKTRFRLTMATAVCSLVVAACTAPPLPDKPPLHTGGVNPDTAAQADVAAYAALGPFAVGVTTVEVEPGRQMEVWYPADSSATVGLTPEAYHLRAFISSTLSSILSPTVDPTFQTPAFRGVASAPGANRPLVLFSHGAMGFRLQSTTITTHLASWGFIVVSPDYFERGLQTIAGETAPAPGRSSADVTQLVMNKANAMNASGDLAGKIDTSRLFPIGHSAGGSQSTALAGSRTDVQSWISMASGVNLTPTIFNQSPTVPVGLANPDKTVMWLGGENDGIAALPGVLNAYDYSAGEKKLVVIPGAGHNNAFGDFCEVGRAEGGLIGLALSGGLTLPDSVINLAQDGCVSPPNYLGPQVWPIVNHFVTAELRYRSGLDPAPVGLGAGVVNQFGGVVPTYRHNE